MSVGRVFGKSMFLALCAAFSIVCVPQAHAEVKSVAESGGDTFTLCKRADGTVPSTVDLLLLFDNSRSLNSKIAKPTDPEAIRFDAVEEMLKAIGSAIDGTNAKVNFGLIKFGMRATVLKTLGDWQISASNAKDLSDSIRRLLPAEPEKQEPSTNYIKALDAAQEMFEASDSTNCRVLVWFTDGAFEYGDKKREEEKLQELRTKTCSSTGWPTRFRELEANSFVVLLGSPPKTQNYKASLELMQALTGDPDAKPIGCGGTLSHVGEVFQGMEAEALGPLFEDIGTRIGGGRILACDQQGTPLQTGEMPAGKFLKFIKLISKSGTPLPGEKDLVVVDRDGGEAPLLTYLAQSGESSAAPASIQWLPGPKSQLRSGWQLKVSGPTRGFCLYGALVDPVTVELDRVADNPVTVSEVGSSLLDPTEISEIEFTGSGRVLSPTEVLDEYNEGKRAGTTPDISARLVVDKTQKIFPDQLQILVQSDDPIPDVSACGTPLTFESPSLLGDMPKDRKNRVFRSTSCAVSTRGTTTKVTVDASGFFRQLKETKGCEDVSPALMVGEVPESSGKGVVVPGTSSSVSVRIEFTGSSAKCEIDAAEGLSLSFELPGSEVKPKLVPVKLKTQLRPPPRSLTVIIVTALTVLFAALLSLLLLRLMNSWLARLPETQGLFSYELEITIDFDSHQFVKGTVDGVPIEAFQPQARDLRPVTSGTTSEMQIQSTRIERKLPGLFSPFQETSAVVIGDETAVYWQQTPSGGLAIPFSTALIVQQSKKIAPTSGSGALLTIVVPRNGADSGIAGVEKILKGSKLSDLLKKFRTEVMDPSSQAPPSESGGGPTSSGGPAGGPKPPPPPPPVRR